MRAPGNLGAPLDQRTGAFFPEHGVDQPVELAFEVGIAHRALEAAERVRDEDGELPAVATDDRHVRRILGERRIDLRRDALAQPDDVGPRDDLVRELALCRLSADDRRGAGVIDTELALEPVARRGLSSQLEHQRMHLERYALDVLRAQTMRIAKLD